MGVVIFVSCPDPLLTLFRDCKSVQIAPGRQFLLDLGMSSFELGAGKDLVSFWREKSRRPFKLNLRRTFIVRIGECISNMLLKRYETRIRSRKYILTLLVEGGHGQPRVSTGARRNSGSGRKAGRHQRLHIIDHLLVSSINASTWSDRSTWEDAAIGKDGQRNCVLRFTSKAFGPERLR